MTTKMSWNPNDDIIEVIIRDGTGSKIEARICNLGDKKSLQQIFTWLRDKYNASLKNDSALLSKDTSLLSMDSKILA